MEYIKPSINKINRDSLILEFFNRQDSLDISNYKYKTSIFNFFADSVNNDEGQRDETSFSIFNSDKIISAELVSKDDGIICGLDEVKIFLDYFSIQYSFLKKDGDQIHSKDVLLKIKGNAYNVLLIERTLVNVLSRMSGIATLTNEFVSRVNGKIKILGTRKTIWNLLDKKAIFIGGGLTHRINLNDGILIKDNHLAATNGDIELALKKCCENQNANLIEIEVSNKKDALKAANVILGLNNDKKYAIMFDNMDHESIENIVKEINVLSHSKVILFEASGKINFNNILNYIDIGIDAVSLGCLTHSVKSLDFSLKVV